MNTVKFVMAAILLGSLGCGEPAPFQGAEFQATDAPPTPDASVAANKQPADNMNDINAGDINRAVTDPADENLTVAKPTDGKRGQGYGGGIITEPLRQRFLLEHRIMFLQMDNAMRMFKTFNNRVPESHDEFMEKIIKAGAVRLPELPDGEEYVYDPEKGELMVRRPN